MSKLNSLAIDLAKNVFQVCGLDKFRHIIFNCQLNRKKLVEFVAQQEPMDIAMEACYSSHYWGRCFQEFGYRVILLPAQHVAPFVRGNKSDHNDVIAIAEAAVRPKFCQYR